MNALGDRIKNIRLELGETMEEFGSRFNTSKGTINNWEKDRNKPNKANLKAIADLGGMTVTELLYGIPYIDNTVDEYLYDNFKEYVKTKDEVGELNVRLLRDSLIEGALSVFGLGEDLSRKSVDDFDEHNSRIKNLKEYGKKYIENNFDNYTYDKFLKDYPNSNPKDFHEFKEKRWNIMKEILDDFWEAFYIPNENYYWINKRFTDQITDELDEISKIAVAEDKEHYYVNEIVQPFLDQAAKDFKEYIKDYIDTDN